MRSFRVRLFLYGCGVVVGILCILAGWRSGQWSLAFLGASQVLLWGVKAGAAVHEHGRFPPPG